MTWPLFLEDLAQGTYRSIYTSEEKPDVTTTPIPRFDLLNIEDYAIIPIQFSRGCPFQCEFCDIIVMFGRRPRTKTPQQLCAELQAVYDTGYRGMVFIVDDNFIGNKREAKRLLPELKAWNEAHGKPFMYGTEASVNLADDAALMQQMVDGNFRWVFVGIETPSMESLNETMKYQNTKRSLLASVKVIQNAGLLVYGGFIIGFDNDTEDIFDRQIEFITQAAIPNAMVGLLVALPGTPLYKRMQETGRLKPDDYEGTSDQCGYTNIVTLLPARTLLEGYRKVIATIYTPHEYFRRSVEAFSRLPHPDSLLARIHNVLALQRVNGLLILRHLRAQNAKKERSGLLMKLTSLCSFFKGLS
ncbi:MAG TPA: radical SAM protein, partial [Gammaproteobacteria bacterium]|nr:radical SAM protein [Gammaproteobacteria bacterium]